MSKNTSSTRYVHFLALAVVAIALGTLLSDPRAPLLSLRVIGGAGTALFLLLLLLIAYSGLVAVFSRESRLRLVELDATGHWFLVPAALAVAWVHRGTFAYDKMPGLLLAFAAAFAALHIGWKVAMLPVRIGWRRSSEGAAGLAVAVVCVLGLVLFSLGAFSRYDRFLAFMSDLGLMIQTVWNTAHGRLLEYSAGYDKPVCRALTGRLELVYLPVALIYHYLQGPKVLLFLQSLFLVAGAVPTYLVGRDVLSSRVAGVVCALAYLAHPALLGVNLAAVHANAFAVPFLLSAFWSLLRANSRGFVLFSVLALACREDVAMVICPLGLYAAVKHRLWKSGGFVAAFAAVWVVLVMFGIPRLTGNPVGLADSKAQPQMLGNLVDGVGGLVQIAVRSPGRLLDEFFSYHNLFYLCRLVVPLGLLCCLSPVALIALPNLLVNMVSGWCQMTDITTQYSAGVLPFLVVAAIAGGRNVADWFAAIATARFGKDGSSKSMRVALSKRGASNGVAGVCAVLLLSATFGAYYFRRPLLLRDYWGPRHTAAMQQRVQQVPKGASLKVCQHLGPHVAQRRYLYNWGSAGSADYLLLDVFEPMLWHQGARPSPTEPLLQLKNPFPSDAMSNKAYGILSSREGVVLWRRGADHAKGLCRFLTDSSPEGLEEVELRATDGLSLVGYRVDHKPVSHGGYFALVLRWRVEENAGAAKPVGIRCRRRNRTFTWNHLVGYGYADLRSFERGEALEEPLLVRVYDEPFQGKYEFDVGAEEQDQWLLLTTVTVP